MQNFGVNSYLGETKHFSEFWTSRLTQIHGPRKFCLYTFNISNFMRDMRILNPLSEGYYTGFI